MFKSSRNSRIIGVLEFEFEFSMSPGLQGQLDSTGLHRNDHYMGVIYISDKMTIHPRLSGTVPVFNDVSQKNITVLLGRPFSGFWLGIPDISRFAHRCISSQKLTRILSINIEKSLAAWALPRTPPESSRRSPRPPSRTPDGMTSVLMGFDSAELTWVGPRNYV